MAKIIIDARKYFDFGIGRYIRNLIRALSKLPTNHDFAVLTSKTDATDLNLPEGWRTHIVSYGKYSLSEFLFLGRNVRKWGVDVFHEPHYTLPIGLRGRAVVTIHDLIHVRFPQFYGAAARAYADIMIRHASRTARSIVTDSEFTRQDLIEYTGIPDDRVHALHCGIDDEFKVLSKSVVEEFKSQQRVTDPYLLYVGNVKPHKNVTTLLTAFSRVAQEFPDMKLVFVGASPHLDRSLARQIAAEGLAQRIHVLGSVSAADLVAAYNGAAITILPSLYEGFGFSAVEAMACGSPVISSNAASLPEIVGEAGLMVDPVDVDGMADAIRSVLTDDQLRDRLVSSGSENVKRFSWRKNAEKTLELYDHITH